MLNDFERYAVYWVPGISDGLSRFGASWMGWCAEMGEARPRQDDAGQSEEIRAFTRDVSRHGFHGVIRAPFRLRDGRSRWSIEHALESVAEEQVCFAMPRLELAVVDGRVSLVPAQTDAALCEALAAAISRVEAAIAPLADRKDAAVRRAAPQNCGGGSLRQLPAGGAHRFHLPLTDRPDLPTAFRIMEELRPWLEPLLAEPRQVSDLALMGDPGEGRPLRVLQRFELRETPRRRASAALPCSGRNTLVPMPNEAMAGTGIAV